MPKPYIVKASKSNFYNVNGQTFIDHKLRLHLGLSNDEYVFLQFIKSYQDVSTKRITYGTLWMATGIDPTDVPPLWKSCKEKGMVYLHESGIVTTTQKFDDCFDIKTNFISFWQIAPKGNRHDAHKMYQKAIKVTSHDNLCECYRRYIKWCDETKTFKKNTSSWLNPASKYWEDKLEIIKKDDKPGQQTTTIEEEW